MVFLKWVRFIVVHVVWERQHVFVNMDETQLASVNHQGVGMIGGRKRKRADRRRAPRDPQDRHHTKVTYIAALSDWLALRVATGAAPSDPAPVHPTCSLSSTNFRRVRWNGPSVRALAQHSTGDITLHRPGLGDSIAQRHQYFQPQGMDHSSIAL